MNAEGPRTQDTFRSFLLMTELEEGKPVSQREMASRLGIALGLVNSYLKTLVKKGFVTVRAYPRNRYAYLLTPKGLDEKSRLAYRHLNNFHKLYRVTRQDSLELFRRLGEQEVTSVSFCGLDELTEIAYLSLQETRLGLDVMMDRRPAGRRFFQWPVVALQEGIGATRGPIIITALQRSRELKAALLEYGVDEREIHGPTLTFDEILRTDGNLGKRRPTLS